MNVPDKSIVRKNFSRGAAHYDEFSFVQRESARILAGLLPEKKCTSILELGCGTGTFTELVLKKYTGSSLTAVDIAPAMVVAAKKKLSAIDRVSVLEADAESMSVSGTFDIITSNATFQWFTDLDKAIKKYHSILSDKGVLVFSIYGQATFIELAGVLKRYFKQDGLLSSQKFHTNERLSTIVSETFKNFEIKEKNFEAQFKCLLDLLREIKQCGARGSGIGKTLTRKQINDLEKLYIAEHGYIKATHNICFCRAYK